MKLAAIYNVWSDWDLLEHSIRCISPLVDGVIVIGSDYSNSGEYSPIPEKWLDGDYVYKTEPPGNTIRDKETFKRNRGLQLALEWGYTHFLTIDSDEFYEPEPFLKAKELFKNPDLNGLVCPLRVYFRSPTLWCEDITLVPFIHKLTPTIRHEFNRRYPFAWDGPQIRIDPTRSLNINSGVEFTKEVTMHHMSWIRSDYSKKIRNSTARVNLERSTIREDLANAKPGYFCKFYQRELKECENRFNIHLNED